MRVAKDALQVFHARDGAEHGGHHPHIVANVMLVLLDHDVLPQYLQQLIITISDDCLHHGAVYGLHVREHGVLHLRVHRGAPKPGGDGSRVAARGADEREVVREEDARAKHQVQHALGGELRGPLRVSVFFHERRRSTQRALHAHDQQRIVIAHAPYCVEQTNVDGMRNAPKQNIQRLHPPLRHTSPHGAATDCQLVTRHVEYSVWQLDDRNGVVLLEIHVRARHREHVVALVVLDRRVHAQVQERMNEISVIRLAQRVQRCATLRRPHVEQERVGVVRGAHVRRRHRRATREKFGRLERSIRSTHHVHVQRVGVLDQMQEGLRDRLEHVVQHFLAALLQRVVLRMAPFHTHQVRYPRNQVVHPDPLSFTESARPPAPPSDRSTTGESYRRDPTNGRIFP